MRGNLFVISAPSGTGKTTILRQVIGHLPRLSFSISHTTRPPRAGEVNGRDYYFIGQEEFLALRERGEFLEWAEVHGNFYGTGKSAVDRALAGGLDLILDIDVQGARQIRAALGAKATFIFIAPPSARELEKRLSGRHTENEATIRLRLANARQEMAELDQYDYLIVNDRVEVAAAGIKAIVREKRLRQRRALDGSPLLFAWEEQGQSMRTWPTRWA